MTELRRILFLLTQAENAMAEAANAMTASYNPDIAHHGAEMAGAASITSGWIVEIQRMILEEKRDESC